MTAGQQADPRFRPLRPEVLLWVHERERVLADELRRAGRDDLDGVRILDVGCGGGGTLARLVSLGLRPADAAGIDLRPEAIETARRLLPAGDFRVGDAARLPYPDGAFDLALQTTALSSMPDAGSRLAAAREMLRVTAPGGLVISYDFWLNPTNRRTVGIDRRELRRLFGDRPMRVRRVTLAPPIARRVAPRSIRLAGLLGMIPFLRTHLLAVVVAGPGQD